MEITSNQTKPVTLEGVTTSARVSVVMPEQKDVAKVDVVPFESIEARQDPKQEKEQNLQNAVSQINDHVQNLQRSLQFTVDEDSGRDVVTVLDTKTEEIIRQYPSEEVLVIARRLAEQKDEVLNLFSSRI